MPSILTEKKSDTVSRFIANQNNGKAGSSMAAVPALQRKEVPQEELQMKAVQLKSDAVQKKGLGDEEEMPVQGKFTIQQKSETEEEPLQMMPFQLKSNTVQKAELPEEDLLQKKPFQLKKGTVQKAATPEEELPVQGKFQPIQKKENKTGLPDNLKSGVENLSGFSMDDVKVHYNSSQPAQLNALAYAQGTDIHVAPGQEEYLPHEAWHVAQQKQGRVQPTMQMKAGVAINDDPGLENEADVMGAKAVQMKSSDNRTLNKIANTPIGIGQLQMKQNTIQRYIPISRFFPLIKGYDNHIRHRLMYWNSANTFDKAEEGKDGDTTLKAKIADYSNISENTGGAELAPGQTNVDQALPNYLNYFSNFTTALPGGMGRLTFKKSFDRLTDHGWISDNIELPKEKFNNKIITAHVILAVSDVGATSESVTINPHVTVRVKQVQDKFDQIALISDRKSKTNEIKALGLEGTLNSLSVGISSDRAKEDTNAQSNVGISMVALKEMFGESWLVGVVADAWNTAKADPNTAKTKTFLIKGLSSASISSEEATRTDTGSSSSSSSGVTAPVEATAEPIVSEAHL
ncbi:eCIS core domain-containing protein [Mucilaginibacter sp.]